MCRSRRWAQTHRLPPPPLPPSPALALFVPSFLDEPISLPDHQLRVVLPPSAFRLHPPPTTHRSPSLACPLSSDRVPGAGSNQSPPPSRQTGLPPDVALLRSSRICCCRRPTRVLSLPSSVPLVLSCLSPSPSIMSSATANRYFKILRVGILSCFFVFLLSGWWRGHGLQQGEW